MSNNTQNIIAIAIAVLAGIWALYMFLAPFIASLRPAKPGRCAGGCGCGHEDLKSEPSSGKADACAEPLKNNGRI